MQFYAKMALPLSEFYFNDKLSSHLCCNRLQTLVRISYFIYWITFDFPCTSIDVVLFICCIQFYYENWLFVLMTINTTQYCVMYCNGNQTKTTNNNIQQHMSNAIVKWQAFHLRFWRYIHIHIALVHSIQIELSGNWIDALQRFVD